MPLPTLYVEGMYEFPPNFELTDKDKHLLKNRPIDIICSLYKEKFLNVGIINRVHFLVAFTGSGKSTVFPSELYEQMNFEYGGVLIAEPRINLTDNGVNDILSHHEQWTLGAELSIHTGNKVVKSEKRTFIEFTTTQVVQNFLQKVIDSKNPQRYLRRYRIIIIDEAHILEIQNLTVIASVKRFLTMFGDDKNCPLFVFASATMDTNVFIKYFNLKVDKYLVSTVRGVPNFPITEIVVNNNVVDELNRKVKNNMYEILAEYLYNNVISNLHTSKSFVKLYETNIQSRDVLVFVPGIRAINITSETLFKLISKDNITFLIKQDTLPSELSVWRKNNKNKKRFLVMGYSASFSNLSLELLEKPYSDDMDVLENETKIVISTSVIETGKTITTLLFSVDIGLNTKTIYNPLIYKYGDNVLIQTPENKSQRTQRKGRCGRVSPGFYIQMFSNEAFDNMEEYDIPETVNRACLSDLLYTTKYKGIDKIARVDFTDYNDFLYPISPDLLCTSLNDLFYGNIIGACGEWLNIEVSDIWKLYAKLSYYILKMPLFMAIMLSAINRFNLPTTFTVSDFNLDTYKLYLKFDFDDIITLKYTKAAEFIPEGRKLFNDIITGKSQFINPYRGDFYS